MCPRVLLAALSEQRKRLFLYATASEQLPVRRNETYIVRPGKESPVGAAQLRQFRCTARAGERSPAACTSPLRRRR